MTDPDPRPLLRTPALSPDGRVVAFVCGGDLWLVDVNGGTAERLTAHPASHRYPRFSPDGATLAFTSGRNGQGEIYVLPLGGGPVRQLTFHDAAATVEDWSPDGRWLYFSSGREQLGSDLYRVGLDGENPAPLYAEPFESLSQLAASPDGSTLAFCNVRDRWWRRGPNPFAPGEIWLGPASPDYGALQLLVGPGSPAGQPALASPYAGRNCWPLWTPDGRELLFVSDRDGVENLWRIASTGGEPQQVTGFADGRLLFPAIARERGTVVFERDGRIWRLDPDGGESEPIPIVIRGDSKFTPVRVEGWTRGYSELRLSPDGKKLAFVARGQIFGDFADKERDRELRQGPAFAVTPSGSRASQLAWTPDSRSLIYVSDRHGESELFRYDFATRQERRLTDDLVPKRLPRISPDGKWVAYLSADTAIRLASLGDEPPRELCAARFVLAADLCWSPDSHWLAFMAHDERAFSNVYVVPAAGGEPRQITLLSNLDGGGLHWTPDGESIVFTTEQYRAEAQIARVDLRPPRPRFREQEFERLFEEQRENEQPKPEPPAAPEAPAAPEQPEQPEQTDESQQPEQPQPLDAEQAAAPRSPAEPQASPPLTIVFEGIARRLRFLTPVQLNASAEAISPDGKDLLLLASVAGSYNLWTLPLDQPREGTPPRQITAGESAKSCLQFAPDGKSVFYLEDGQIVSRKFPAGDGVTRPYTRADVQLDFQRDKFQIFGEAWRALRDSFYDPSFRGQDWAAIRQQFAPLVAGAATTEELHTLINMMVGELRASHLGSGFHGWPGSSGYTGILFAADAARDGRLVVERVLPESPAALVEQPPLPGEQLVGVDGQPLGPGTSLDRVLRRTVGRRVRLEFAMAEGRREVQLRPIDADEYHRLRYRDWSAQNRAYVERVSNQRLGYVHIPQMSHEAYQQFLVDLDAATHGRAGVVVDVRYNGGGHIAPFILDVLTRRATLMSGFRDAGGVDAGHLAGSRVLNRPTVLVTNERSASNTEMLSASYRSLGLGKVVGRPTAGAVIWTFGLRLLDGAALRLPRFYVVTPEGEDLEGRGRPVDVEVIRPLGEWARGVDRQLDAAVGVLLGD